LRGSPVPRWQIEFEEKIFHLKQRYISLVISAFLALLRRALKDCPKKIRDVFGKVKMSPIFAVPFAKGATEKWERNADNAVYM
jgi:hypothetical protein